MMALRLVMICLLVLAPAARARETLHWILYPDFPPARIASGPLAGQGIIDRQLAWLLSQLGEFDHVLVEATNAQDRNFGPAISRFQRSEPSGLMPIPSLQQALAMMVRGRLDYTFGYFSEVLYFRRVADPAGGVTFVPVAGSPALLPVYIACSRGPLGERAIRSIDRVLERTDGAVPYLPEIREWFAPDEFRQIADPANWRN